MQIFYVDDNTSLNFNFKTFTYCLISHEFYSASVF